MKVKGECLNCGEIIESEVYEDELGTYIVCPKCEASSDVDVEKKGE